MSWKDAKKLLINDFKRKKKEELISQLIEYIEDSHASMEIISNLKVENKTLKSQINNNSMEFNWVKSQCEHVEKQSKEVLETSKMLIEIQHALLVKTND